ncbi:hypothetical protein DFH06DRAFT_1308669 [Mycena polygramma]|nr:hypothetical protein DFH06DRAFT_1308669 [Mycena polygramma]
MLAAALLAMPSTHPSLHGDFRNVRFSSREDDNLAKFIATHEKLANSRYFAAFYAVLGPKASEDLAWSRHRSSTSWMKRYRNNKATFDPEILRYKAEVKQPRDAPADSPPSKLPQETNPDHRTPVKRRFPETLSTRSTLTEFSRKSNPAVMRPLSSLADAFVAASSTNANDQSDAGPAAKTPQSTRRPHSPKLSIPQESGAERRPFPLTHAPTAQVRRRTQTFQPTPLPDLTTLSTSRPAPQPAQTQPTTDIFTADPAAVHAQLSNLCRESIFSVDRAWAVYADTHSVERTATALHAMEAAAEARGVELMGEDWTYVIGRLKRKKGMDENPDGNPVKKKKKRS